MSSQSERQQLSYLLLFLQHTALQVPKFHIMCIRQCLFYYRCPLIHLQQMLNIWNSRDSSGSLVTRLRCARGENLGSIFGMDTGIGLSLSPRQPPVQSVSRAISSMMKLPKR